MTLKASLDRTNLETLPDGLRTIKLGTTLAQDAKQTVRLVDFTALGGSAYCDATVHALHLPDDTRAMTVVRAFARTGAAGTGELAVQAPGTVPITNQTAVQPNGDIAVLAADALTSVDIEYLVARGDVFEWTGPVVANVLAFPAFLVTRGVIMATEVEATVGGAPGDKVVLVPGTAPAAGEAALNVAKSQIAFNAADAVTQARAKLLVVSEFDLTTNLEAETPALL